MRGSASSLTSSLKARPESFLQHVLACVSVLFALGLLIALFATTPLPFATESASDQSSGLQQVLESASGDSLDAVAALVESGEAGYAETIYTTRSITASTIDSLPSSGELTTFCLFKGTTMLYVEDRLVATYPEPDAPEIEQQKLDALQQAISKAEKQGDVGIVLINMDTGQGITYNVDQKVYGASSFKALYSLYLCETLVETGKLDLGESGVSSLIEAAVVNSDNQSYELLRDVYDSQGFDKWVKKLGAAECKVDVMSDYPEYCPRTSAKLWLHALRYFETDTKTAQWLKALTGKTTYSYLRIGLKGSDAKIYDKAGWINEGGLSSSTDAGIVELNGSTYLVSVMTNMPASEQSEKAMARMVAALFDLGI